MKLYGEMLTHVLTEYKAKNDKIWKFYIQSKYFHSFLRKYINISPVVHFLPVTIVKNQE